MNKDYHSPTMDNAIDMHKLIRFLTLSLSGDGYLDFMGNEFGHPEWIDFPREGNNWSYHYARRQWSLVNNPDLKFRYLADFDRDMIHFASEHGCPGDLKPQALWLDQGKNVLIFKRGNLVFVFNMHPTNSYEDIFINCDLIGAGRYKVVFSTDDSAYGGQDRISKECIYNAGKDDYGFGFRLYVPCRSAAVIKSYSKGK